MSVQRGYETFLDHPDLVERWRRLGMDVGDPVVAERILRTYGYHRLTSYSYVFRRMLPEDQRDPQTRLFRDIFFVEGTSLEAVTRLYEFDSRLREVFLRGLFDFETRLRAAIAHVLASRSPLAHIEEQHLNEKACRQGTYSGSTKFEAWKETYRESLEGAVDEDFIVHHVRTPSQELPVWATVELVSFGKLPFLFDLMRQEDQNRVARRFGVRNGRQFGKWIRALVEGGTCAPMGAGSSTGELSTPSRSIPPLLWEVSWSIWRVNRDARISTSIRRSSHTCCSRTRAAPPGPWEA